MKKDKDENTIELESQIKDIKAYLYDLISQYNSLGNTINQGAIKLQEMTHRLDGAKDDKK